MKTAFIFPGQGAQYPGMAKDFIEAFPVAKRTFEEADDLLGRKLSEIVINGPDALLTETKNSQTGIYVASLAILRTVRELFPELAPAYTAGLSLGEYTAATACGLLPFSQGLPLVQFRGQYMNDACEEKQGAMAVILGLDEAAVLSIIADAGLPEDLFAANFNCPGQVVVSGTLRGIEAASKIAKEKGAKRVLPLQVYGAFHSGLMASAKARLKPKIEAVAFSKPSAKLIMNVTGNIAEDEAEIRKNLIDQVTSPVRWEGGVRTMDREGVELYLEMGPGKTLAGFNKRIGVSGRTVSVETVDDLKLLESALTV